MELKQFFLIAMLLSNCLYVSIRAQSRLGNMGSYEVSTEQQQDTLIYKKPVDTTQVSSVANETVQEMEERVRKELQRYTQRALYDYNAMCPYHYFEINHHRSWNFIHFDRFMLWKGTFINATEYWNWK